MTSAFIMDYIPQKMAQLGFGDDYMILSRSYFVPAGTTVDIIAWNQWFFLPYESAGSLYLVKVESNFGQFLSTGYPGIIGAAFLQVLEHTDRISVTNDDTNDTNITFIVAMPICNKIPKPNKN